MKSSVTYDRRMASLKNAVAPIIDFLEKETVVEVMLNADGSVWVDEIGEGMYCTDVVMSWDQAERLIRLVAASINAEINERNPSLSAKLPGWGARVQASVPPIVEAPVFSLRIPPRVIFSLDDYVARSIMTQAQADLLVDAVKSRQNILVGGGTGSGKSTLTNALLKVIAEETSDRIYIVEDTPELQCQAKNKLQILVQDPLYSYRQAIKDALRYRPDRILVGEVRDGSALDMLKAWNTGHPGGIATVHADTPILMLERIGQLIEEVVPIAPKYLIAEAIDICVHIERDSEHPSGRLLSGIARVSGLDSGNDWVVNDL